MKLFITWRSAPPPKASLTLSRQPYGAPPEAVHTCPNILPAILQTIPRKRRPTPMPTASNA